MQILREDDFMLITNRLACLQSIADNVPVWYNFNKKSVQVKILAVRRFEPTKGCLQFKLGPVDARLPLDADQNGEVWVHEHNLGPSQAHDAIL